MEVRALFRDQGLEHVVDRARDEEAPGGEEDRGDPVAGEEEEERERELRSVVPTEGMNAAKKVIAARNSGWGTCAIR